MDLGRPANNVLPAHPTADDPGADAANDGEQDGQEAERDRDGG